MLKCTRDVGGANGGAAQGLVKDGNHRIGLAMSLTFLPERNLIFKNPHI